MIESVHMLLRGMLAMGRLLIPSRLSVTHFVITTRKVKVKLRLLYGRLKCNQTSISFDTVINTFKIELRG